MITRYKFDTQSIKDGIEMLKFPVDVIVETSGYCNLKCVMCPQPGLKRPKGFMSFDTFRRIADEISSVKPDTALWLALMGEPLVNPENVLSKIRYAKGLGLKNVRLNTNGTLLFPDVADRLIASGLDYILISVDAHAAKTYERIRVGGNFKTLTKNINYLLKARDKEESRLNVVVQFIVMDENETEVEQFKKAWVNKGAIVKIRPKLSWGNTVEASNLELTQEQRSYPCPWLMRTMSVHWTGKLGRCDFDYEGLYSPGDVNEISLEDLWNGPVYEDRMRHVEGDFTHPLCRECKDWQVGRAIYFDHNGQLEDSKRGLKI